MTVSKTESLIPNSPPARRRSVDVFIALLVAIFALDTLPCTPAPIRNWMRPLLSATGLWQGPWNLFSPIPDSSNHRIRADLYFTDGTHHVWNSPEWKTQTAWQRFVGHRDSEFIEKIWEDENSAAWPRFAEFLMQQERQQFPSLPPPDRIALSVILTEILPPDRTTWSTLNSSTGPRHERVFFTLVFPE